MMRVNIMSLILAMLISALLFNCSDADDLLVPPALDTGTADFSNYVSVGNSLTAGYSSGALLIRDSQYSFPNLIAQQTEASFVQPIIEYPGLGGFDPATGTIFGVYELASLAGSPTRATAVGDPMALFTNATAPAFNNLGIPGILMYDALYAVSSTTTASAMAGGDPNTFVDIVLRGSGNSPLGQAIAQSPTFVTLWIGNNDVLGAVVNGDVIPGMLPTPTATFQMLFEGIVASLANAGIDFLVANIPSVSSIPYTTTLPPYVFDPVTKEVVLVGGLPIPWTGITDPENSMVLLGASSYLAASIPAGLGGPGVPLADELWLDPQEILAINTAVEEYNDVIMSLSVTYNYGVVDVNYLLEMASLLGISNFGETVTTDFVTGGIFSLDGIHPSPRGNGIIANEFIKAINAFFSANIKLVNPNDLPALVIPTGKTGKPLSYYDIYRDTDMHETVKALFPVITH